MARVNICLFVLVVVFEIAFAYNNKAVETVHRQTIFLDKRLNETQYSLKDELDVLKNNLETFIKWNNENIKNIILEEIQPKIVDWEKIVKDECILNGQFAIDSLRTLDALKNIEKISTINRVMETLNFDVLEKFVNISVAIRNA